MAPLSICTKIKVQRVRELQQMTPGTPGDSDHNKHVFGINNRLRAILYGEDHVVRFLAVLLL